MSTIDTDLGCKEGAMRERKGLITMNGNPLTLMGNEVKVGGLAPDYEAALKAAKELV